AGYDSNVALESLAVPATSRTQGAVAAVDAAAGLTYGRIRQPFSLMLRLYSQSSATDDALVKSAAPTFVEAALDTETYAREWLLGADMRYSELFTDFFNTHRQRMLSPTAWVAHPVGILQRFRLLVGADYRQPFGELEANDNI